MAAAQNAVLIFVGNQTRKTYSVSMYTADTAAYINRWALDTVAGTGSETYFRAPENLTLIDFSMTTGTTQTTMVMTENGAVRNGCVLSFVAHVSTNSNRPKLAIPFAAGSLIGAKTI